jgi:fatty-acyl-CoA synthase
MASGEAGLAPREPPPPPPGRSGVAPIAVPVRDWVAYHAMARPDAVAVHCFDSGESRTWMEFDQRVGALAAGLRDRMGVARGDRIALLAENDVRTFELQFACIRMGAIFVPLNWRLELPELAETIADCQPVLLIHDDTHAQSAARLAAGRAPRLLSWGGPGPASGYEELVAGGRFLPGGLLDPEAITQITYTSGTSGRPKGVTGANRTALFHALNMAATSRFAEVGGHHLNMLPLFWAGGLNTFTLPMFYWGGRVTTTRRFDESVSLRLLDDPSVAVTHVCAAPEMYLRMAALPEFATAEFATLRRALVGGWRPDTARLHAQWRERGVFIQLAYGSSETGPNVTVLQRDEPELIEQRSCGTPVPFTLLRLVDDDEADVPRGEVGEIWVSGPAVTPGYWNRDPAGVFRDGWFRTGDLGRLGPHGDLYVVDRIKEIIRSGGTNVYPAEIERVLIDHPSVREVAVIAVPDAQFGEVALAVVVPGEGATVTLEDLVEHARDRLARYKRPRHLVLTDELPRNASDKIERHVLKARYAGQFASALAEKQA